MTKGDSVGTCAGCGTDLAEGARFCPACGTPVARGCASCGALLVAPFRFCMECGTPQSGAPAAPATPEPPVTARRRASVLFADLVGFTTLSESRDTEDVRDLLGRYFEECRSVIGRYGGQVEKFIGDAVMAVWGADVSHEDDAERAVRAGLELVATVAGFADDVHATGLALRVGIVSDQVAVNLRAVTQGGQGMVAGDPVNTAARVQSAATPGTVWVDETTKNLTAAAIAYADAGHHELKGKAEPMRLFEATAVVAAVGGAQRADGLEAPLVGRARELRVVKELFHAADESRSPVLVVVAGEAGVGKTRLGWEFEKYVDGLTATTRWHSGRCLSYGEGVSFYALAEAVRGRLLTLVDPDEPQPSEATLIDRALEEWVPADERGWLRTRLAALLGQGATGMTKEDLFIAWGAFFRHVGAGEPVTLLVDDAQHADDGLLAFVEFLLNTGDFPLFILLMTRPDLLARASGLVTHHRSHLVSLPTLAADDVASLVDGLVPQLPERLRAQLVDRADGIPLYAVETVRSLVDRDLVVPRDGVYTLADPGRAADLDLESLGVPASLHALVAARLDRLGPEQRTVVDRAAVLGLSFFPDALTTLAADAGLAADAVAEALASLVRAQVLTQETSRLSSEQGQYKFVQAIVRQVAYDTLSRKDRKRLHLDAVAHLEASGLSGEDTAAVRAQHHLDALSASGPDDQDLPRLRDAAVELLAVAADRALALGAPREAVRHLVTALDLGPSTDQTVADLHQRAADAAVVANDWDAVEGHAQRALELWERSGDVTRAGLAAAMVARLKAIRGDLRGAALDCEPWWERLQAEPDDPWRDKALLALSYTVLYDPSPRRMAWEATRWRLVHSERTADHKELANTYNQLSLFASVNGAPQHGLELLRTAADHARAGHDPRTLALLLGNLAGTENLLDLRAATGHAQECIEQAQLCGDDRLVDLGRTNLAVACWTGGEWDRTSWNVGSVVAEVLGSLHDLAEGRWTDEGSPSGSAEDALDGIDIDLRSWATFTRSLHHQLRSRHREALEDGRVTLQVQHEMSGITDDFGFFFPHVARLACDLGDDAFLVWLTGLVDEARDAAPLGLRAHRRHVAGLVAARAGDDEAALAAYTEAIELLGRWGAVPFEARAHADLGVLLRRTGRTDEAEPHLTHAREVFARLGAAAWAAELDDSLAEATV